MNTERAGRLVSLMNHPGWRDIKDMAAEHIADSLESLTETMVSSPDKLTGKTAIAKGNRARGIRDFIEDIEEAKKIFPQSARSGY